MITTISTSTRDYEETVNSLKYAIRAKSIKNNAIKNSTESAENAATEMTSIIESLKKENEALKKVVGDGNINSSSPKRVGRSQGGSNNILADLERKIRTHFETEKAIRQKKAEIEETVAGMNNEMESNGVANSDLQMSKLNHMYIEKSKIAEDLGVMMKERAKLVEEVNDSGLNNIQITFLSNIIYKEQIEAVITFHEA